MGEADTVGAVGSREEDVVCRQFAIGKRVDP